jgi:hypothetical protein
MYDTDEVTYEPTQIFGICVKPLRMMGILVLGAFRNKTTFGNTGVLIDGAIKLLLSQNVCVVVEFRKGGNASKGCTGFCVGGKAHRGPNIDPTTALGLPGVTKHTAHYLSHN